MVKKQTRALQQCSTCSHVREGEWHPDTHKIDWRCSLHRVSTHPRSWCDRFEARQRKEARRS